MGEERIMATIPVYVAKTTHVGQRQIVKAKKVIWVPVGEGAVTDFTDYEVGIAGKISVLGYSGALHIHLQLKDREPDAVSGPCFLRLNTHMDENARYEARNGTLTVYANLGGQQQNIAIQPANRGAQTECKLFGRVNQTVHLEPQR